MKKTICILTGQIAKTQGDISAAFKLINSILKANTQDLEISINWLIYFSFSENIHRYYDFYIENAKAKKVNLGCVTNSLQMLRQIQEWEPNTDLFMLFPATPFRVGNVLGLDCFKKPILIVTEYNYQQIFMLDQFADFPIASLKRISKRAQIYNSGFGINKLGVLFTRNAEDLLPAFMPASIIDRKLLQQLSLLKANDDYVAQANVDEYKHKHALYVAYFNAATYLDVQNGQTVNANSFCEISIRLGYARHRNKNLDIMVNFSGLKPNINLSYLRDKFSAISFIDSNLDVVKTYVLNSNHNLPIVTIIDPYPISNDCLQFLLQSSEAFSGLTGDQSFTEGVQYNKLVFYQIMNWKSEIPEGFLELCAKYIGKDSVLYKYYSIVMYDNTLMYSNFYRFISYFWQFEFDCNSMTNFILENEKTLLEQMQQFSESLRANHELSNNLLQIIYKNLCITKEKSAKLTL